MWFIIRTGFWFSLVLLALPLGGAGGEGGRSMTGMGDAIAAAQGAVADMSGFCARRAETCDTGRKVAGEVAARAKTAAHLALVYLDQNGRSTADDTMATGSIAIPSPRPRP